MRRLCIGSAVHRRRGPYIPIWPFVNTAGWCCVCSSMMCGNPGVHGRGVPDGVMLDGTCLVRCAGAVWRSMTWYASILPVGLLLNVRAFGSLCKSPAALWSPCPGDPVRCHLPPIALLLPPNGAFWLIPILGPKRSQTFAEVPLHAGRQSLVGSCQRGSPAAISIDTGHLFPFHPSTASP